MTDRSRRRLFGSVTGALLAQRLHDAVPAAGPPPSVRVRTITAGVRLGTTADPKPLEAAIAFLHDGAQAFRDAGYEVQTIRIATQPLAMSLGGWSDRLLANLLALDRVVSERNVFLSIGPLIRDDHDDADFPAWVARLMAGTSHISCSISIASPSRRIRRHAARTAAASMAAIANATPGGEGNFRFAAAAHCPPGIPFFPVAYHSGEDAFALGLESAPLVAAAFAGAPPRPEAQARLKALLETRLAAVERIARDVAARTGRRYLGIDASPAPGKDASIAAGIEALTGAPFGDISTLDACAALTDVIKNLTAARTCGYTGLMLPVLEDPVLARRAAERRYRVKDLLLYSSVSGTGLDLVPLPGDTPVDRLAAVILDVGALAVKLQKPLAARLLPIPGKSAGEPVHFANPFLTDSVVMPPE